MDQIKVSRERARCNFKWVAAHLFTLMASLAIAQRTTGALSGQVLDLQGATVPSAKISVTDVIPICEGAGGMTFQGANGPPAVGGTFAITPLGGGGASYDPNDLSGITILPAFGYLAADPTAKYVVAGPDVKATIERNSFRSPGFGVMNLSVGKTLMPTESAHHQLKADFYNALNHKTFTIFNANVFSTAGVTATTSNSGYVQIADPNLLNPKIFSGDNRQMALTAKFVL
jgi:hypothetical protein